MTVTNKFKVSSMLSMEEYGQHLRNVRFRCGIKTISGINKEEIISIERGDRYPTLPELYLIAEHTCMPLWELIPLSENIKVASHRFALQEVASTLHKQE